MKAGGELKVTVCIGLDPWNLLAGGTSVEYGVDESRIASALSPSCLGKPMDSVRIKSGLTVPAEAEYVLEGRLINEVHDEGPFVDAVRTYDRVRKEPVLVVDRIYHRDRPIFHIIVGGLDEHFMFMGMPREPWSNRPARAPCRPRRPSAPRKGAGAGSPGASRRRSRTDGADSNPATRSLG